MKSTSYIDWLNQSTFYGEALVFFVHLATAKSVFDRDSTKGGSSKLSSSKYRKFSTLGIKRVLAARGIREKDVVM